MYLCYLLLIICFIENKFHAPIGVVAEAEAFLEQLFIQPTLTMFLLGALTLVFSGDCKSPSMSLPLLTWANFPVDLVTVFWESFVCSGVCSISTKCELTSKLSFWNTISCSLTCLHFHHWIDLPHHHYCQRLNTSTWINSWTVSNWSWFTMKPFDPFYTIQ